LRPLGGPPAGAPDGARMNYEWITLVSLFMAYAPTWLLLALFG
jgi:hypothetical protein